MQRRRPNEVERFNYSGDGRHLRPEARALDLLTGSAIFAPIRFDTDSKVDWIDTSGASLSLEAAKDNADKLKKQYPYYVAANPVLRYGRFRLVECDD